MIHDPTASWDATPSAFQSTVILPDALLSFLDHYFVWIITLVILTVFGWLLRRERRQTRRLAERTQELEHLSAELIRSNRVKSEFLANVSHELRTPLNAIVGFVELLRDGVYGDLTPRQSAPVQRIEASANHLRHLVDQILDLAKMAAGRLDVHDELMDLRPFVLDVASEVEPLVTEKKLQLSLALGAALPKVRTDPTHLRQILMNLLGNAIKYTNTGSIVIRARLVPTHDLSIPTRLRALFTTASDTPSPFTAPFVELFKPTSTPASVLDRIGVSNDAQPVTPPKAWIAIQVIDTGMGIDPTDHTRIFEEFEQVGAGPRGDSIRRGTGLGLSISRRLARLLGGDVTLESTVGKGSTFTVWLPVDEIPS